MFKICHIWVAGRTLDSIQSKVDWKINRAAYLFGSVAPDINYVYPVHTFNSTFNRFKKKIKRAEKSNTNIIKSFTLGVITHYICDYFCYAHNIRMGNPKHVIYERIMRSHMKKHTEALSNSSEELRTQWMNILGHTLDSMQTCKTVEDVLDDIHSKGKDHIDYIMKAITEMHDTYIKYTLNLEDKEWFKSIEKMELDMQYARFMCERILMFILSPEAEIVVQA